MFNQIDINIENIKLAHNFTLYEGNKLNYLNGRKTYGLILVIDGSMCYKFKNNKELQVKSGDMVFFNPQASYNIKIDDYCKHYTINFTIQNNSKSTSFNNLFVENNYITCKATPYGYFEKMFDDCSNTFLYKKYEYILKMKSIILKIIYEFFKCIYKDSLQPNQNNLIKPAINYIEEHWTEKCPLDKLAKECHLSTTHFRRIFNQVTNMSPAEYKAKYIIEYTKDLILSNEYSIKEIAYSCGFEDPNYFSRFFKKHTGYSPNTFFEMNKN